MCISRAVVVVVIAAVLLQSLEALVSAQGSSPWQTLSGDAPLVIARGGFSGLFPDSSTNAYRFALIASSPNVVLWCDIQLTKDRAGICFPDLKLDNASDIANVFSNNETTHLVNGVPTQGWFSVDFNLDDLLTKVILQQSIGSRIDSFDGNLFQIFTVQEMFIQFKPPGLWLNVQHDAFFTQHNLNMTSFVLNVSRSVVVSYISSPEVGFLRSITSQFTPNITKLIFRFLGENEVDPSTNQTYDSLSKNLTFIKTFATGLLVPKAYIWPVDDDGYLLPHTSIVLDAHKEGLEVYASDFVNDVPLSYDYSYDPVSEYLSFVDNGNFSVDGVLSDFPLTPSAAIDCFSHLDKNASRPVKPLIISKNGASGDYPGCTNEAYSHAISDGADVLDCPVQMTKDGIPFCLSSINLIDSSLVAQSSFINYSRAIPELGPGNGIFTFDLTWEDIKGLTPSISNPYRSGYNLFRNPKKQNSGSFVTLSDFLSLTINSSSLSGVLINIENAAYLVEKERLSVADAVLDALTKAGYDNHPTQKVLIHSTKSSVLLKFKEKSNYKLVYNVEEIIRDIENSTIQDIKKFADSVVLKKSSVFPENNAFLTGSTRVVEKLQAVNLSVYVEIFRNEFVSQAWDFFSDPTVEINTYVMGANIDGVVTEFPKTAASYRMNQCLNLGNNTPPYMSPIAPGSLLQLVTSAYMPPAEAPNPVLTDADVAESPLGSILPITPTSSSGEGTPSTPAQNGQPKVATSIFMSTLAILLSMFLMSRSPYLFFPHSMQ